MKWTHVCWAHHSHDYNIVEFIIMCRCSRVVVHKILFSLLAACTRTITDVPFCEYNKQESLVGQGCWRSVSTR